MRRWVFRGCRSNQRLLAVFAYVGFRGCPGFDWRCFLLLVFWAITAFVCVGFSNAFLALPAIFPPRLATSLLFSVEFGAFGFSCREIVFVVNSANWLWVNSLPGVLSRRFSLFKPFVSNLCKPHFKWLGFWGMEMTEPGEEAISYSKHWSFSVCHH